MAHKVTLTVEATFDGEYYSRSELVDVMSGWIISALEDRDDLDSSTVKVTGKVQDTYVLEPFNTEAVIKALFRRDK